eukprot:snap_masked-scaffold_16-processed-gene-2.4-mRNA-1 protein AED:1.00 eAED:1.00 QI:0/0/0/0/1/1/2/0/63
MQMLLYIVVEDEKREVVLRIGTLVSADAGTYIKRCWTRAVSEKCTTDCPSRERNETDAIVFMD